MSVDTEEEAYIYVFVRTDYGTPANQAVQAIHAVYAATKSGVGKNYWSAEPGVILLACDNLQQLKQAMQTCDISDVKYSVFVEDDGIFTAICTVPVMRVVGRELSRFHKLWKGTK